MSWSEGSLWKLLFQPRHQFSGHSAPRLMSALFTWINLLSDTHFCPSLSHPEDFPWLLAMYTCDSQSDFTSARLSGPVTPGLWRGLWSLVLQILSVKWGW